MLPLEQYQSDSWKSTINSKIFETVAAFSLMKEFVIHKGFDYGACPAYPAHGKDHGTEKAEDAAGLSSSSSAKPAEDVKRFVKRL